MENGCRRAICLWQSSIVPNMDSFAFIWNTPRDRDLATIKFPNYCWTKTTSLCWPGSIVKGPTAESTCHTFIWPIYKKEQPCHRRRRGNAFVLFADRGSTTVLCVLFTCPAPYLIGKSFILGITSSENAYGALDLASKQAQFSPAVFSVRHYNTRPLPDEGKQVLWQLPQGYAYLWLWLVVQEVSLK